MAYDQGMNINYVHVTIQGVGHDIDFSELDGSEYPSASDLKRAVEMYLDVAPNLLTDYVVDGYPTTGQVTLFPDTKLGADEDEFTVRSRILDSLLRCPHRDMKAILKLHQEMLEADPEFYAHLSVWAWKNTKVRDHKEAFVATLFGSGHLEFREVAYVLMQDIPPYQVARIKGHVEGQWSTLNTRPGKTATQAEKTRHRQWLALKKRVVESHTSGDVVLSDYYSDVRAIFGLPGNVDIRGKFYRGRATTKDGVKTRKVKVRFEKFEPGVTRRAPRIMKSGVTTYLRRMERDTKRFDRATVRQYNALKTLYAGFRIRPSDLADQVLFKTPPEGTKRHAMREIARTRDPVEWAKKVISADIPFPVAVGLCPTGITPVHLVGLINQMSSAELLSNLSALEARGAMDNFDVKSLIERKLEKAKTSKRVDALKASQAADQVSSRLDEETAKKVRSVTDAQVSESVKIKKKTVLAIDASSSMDTAIDVGKQIGALIAPACTSDFMCVSFTDLCRVHQVEERSKMSSWEHALRYVQPKGRTYIRTVVDQMERSGREWEQIVLVTDEGDNGTPKFSVALSSYIQSTGRPVNVVIVRLQGSGRYGTSSNRVEAGLRAKDIEVDVFDMTQGQKATGTVDYYSLPNLLPMLAGGSRAELLMDIMDIPLPNRSAYDSRVRV